MKGPSRFGQVDGTPLQCPDFRRPRDGTFVVCRVPPVSYCVDDEEEAHGRVGPKTVASSSLRFSVYFVPLPPRARGQCRQVVVQSTKVHPGTQGSRDVVLPSKSDRPRYLHRDYETGQGTTVIQEETLARRDRVSLFG